jgi:hypothetical protein
MMARIAWKMPERVACVLKDAHEHTRMLDGSVWVQQFCANCPDVRARPLLYHGGKPMWIEAEISSFRNRTRGTHLLNGELLSVE